MRNGRCYRHGGPSTGPRTPEGLQRIKQARTLRGIDLSDVDLRGADLENTSGRRDKGGTKM